MAHFFKANEIANVAVEIERKGHEFYLQAAQAAKTEKVKELFQFLAEEEAKHEKIFAGLLSRLGTIELPAWSTKQEYAAYLDALIESHALFGGLAQKYLTDAPDEETAIRLAMNFEKDTMFFFMEMKTLVPESEHQAVDVCIEEERTHLRKLKEMLDA